MTLAQFKTMVKPSLDMRDAISTLENQLIAASDQRDDADAESMKQILLVVIRRRLFAAERGDGRRPMERSSGHHEHAFTLMMQGNPASRVIIKCVSIHGTPRQK